MRFITGIWNGRGKTTVMGHIANYRDYGALGIPRWIMYSWLAIGLVITTFSTIFAPIFAWFFISVFFMWDGGRHERPITLSSGFEAFKKNVMGDSTNRQWFFGLFAGLYGGMIIAFFTSMIGLGAAGGVIMQIAAAGYYAGWFVLVRASIRAGLPTADELRRQESLKVALAATLNIAREKMVINSQFKWTETGGFMIYPTPESVTRLKMEETIRENALKFLPEYELMQADHIGVYFEPLSDAERDRRAGLSRFGGMLTERDRSRGDY